MPAARQVLLSQEFRKHCKHPGKTDSESGADPQNYAFAHVGVMSRAEFCRATLRGVVDRLLDCRVYDRRDNTRLNVIWDMMIAHSVPEPVCTRRGRVYPYRDLVQSKGDAWNQRYQVLKTGWSVALYPSDAVCKLVDVWRSADAARSGATNAREEGQRAVAEARPHT